MANTLYWHDYETFGSDPRSGRPCQFAGLRSDENLNEVGEPLLVYCRPAPDFLPDPESCLITGIGPATALERGLPEAEFCAAILGELGRPGTCAVGYNSIRFDEEFTRHLLYRCLQEPYEREWRNGNSRWDIIDMLRLCHALRPEGIEWPRRDDGSPSFRLEELTRANGLEHSAAHDALSDVRATLQLARLVRQRQPRLYDWFYQLRHKQRVLPLLDPERREPVLHVSSMYPSSQGCLAVVIPLLRHPGNGNSVLVYDLACDPSPWLQLPAEEIRRRLFTPAAELPEGVARIPLKTVHANKCPVVAPLSVLSEANQARWEIDLARCRRHLEMLEAADGLQERLAAAFAREEPRKATEDPDLMLYSGGFLDDADRAALARVRALDPAGLAACRARFRDPRLAEMLFRYRARNWPESLTAGESERWRAHCRRCLEDPASPSHLPSYLARLAELRRSRPEKAALLAELEMHARAVAWQAGLVAAEASAP